MEPKGNVQLGLLTLCLLGFLSLEENVFLFDGKTYVDLPDNVVPEDIGDQVHHQHLD